MGTFTNAFGETKSGVWAAGEFSLVQPAEEEAASALSSQQELQHQKTSLLPGFLSSKINKKKEPAADTDTT